MSSFYLTRAKTKTNKNLESTQQTKIRAVYILAARQIIQHHATPLLLFLSFCLLFIITSPSPSPLPVCQVVTETDPHIDMVELFAYDNVCRLQPLIKYEIAGCI